MKRSHPTLFAFLALLLGTPVVAAVETWTDLDGRSMEAEFISASSTYVSFRKADGARYIFPLDKLTAADQARIRERAGTVAAGTTPASLATPATPPAAPALAGKFTSEVSGKLVTLKSGGFTPLGREAIHGARFYAIYYSAQWCPPCRAFTPTLVESYKTLKADHPEFELIFVSSDEDADAMKTYMKDYKMPWPALRHDLVKSLPAVTRHAGNGIPHLVFLTADGEVLSSSYVNGKYVGPRKVLADIKAKLGAKG